MGSSTYGQKGEYMDKFILNLQQFTEGPEAAGATAPGAEGAGSQAGMTEGPLRAGETLADGTVLSDRLATEMNRQMKRHPELKAKYVRNAPQAKAAGAQVQQPQQQVDAPAAQAAAQQQGPEDLQTRWNAAKKGEFAQLYGQDVQKAIQDRLKNQKDLKGELDKLEPALKVLRERAGVESNDDLVKQIMDDDSLCEEAASEAGMTVDAYKNYLKFKEEHDKLIQAQQEHEFREGVQRHYSKLAQQAEALKAQFPGFDLDTELQNEQFRRLTAPDIGMSVEDAFFAVHHKELAPQMLAYGMQRAKEQMAQTVAANGNRPREGGLGNYGNTPTDNRIDPRNLTRKERDALSERVHRKERITFD